MVLDAREPNFDIGWKQLLADEKNVFKIWVMDRLDFNAFLTSMEMVMYRLDFNAVALPFPQTKIRTMHRE